MRIRKEYIKQPIIIKSNKEKAIEMYVNLCLKGFDQDTAKEKTERFFGVNPRKI